MILYEWAWYIYQPENIKKYPETLFLDKFGNSRAK